MCFCVCGFYFLSTRQQHRADSKKAAEKPKKDSHFNFNLMYGRKRVRLVSSVLGNDNKKIKLIDISDLYQKLLSKTDMMRDAVEFVSMQTLEPEPRRHHNKKTSTGQCFICHLYLYYVTVTWFML